MGRYLRDKKDRRSGLDLFTPEEEEVLLTTALKDAPRYYCLLLCALRTGLRIAIKITVDTYGYLIPGANKAAVDRLDVTGRNPTATESGPTKDDASVSF